MILGGSPINVPVPPILEMIALADYINFRVESHTGRQFDNDRNNNQDRGDVIEKCGEYRRYDGKQEKNFQGTAFGQFGDFNRHDGEKA